MSTNRKSTPSVDDAGKYLATLTHEELKPLYVKSEFPPKEILTDWSDEDVESILNSRPVLPVDQSTK